MCLIFFFVIGSKLCEVSETEWYEETIYYHDEKYTIHFW